jgi:hypothetical protein
MEEIYSDHTEVCSLVKTKPQTIDFILNYSKALRVHTIKGITIEHNLN